MRSKLFNLDSRDFYKGLVIAFITALLTALYDSFTIGEVTFKSILFPTLAATISYLLKNLFTNSSDKILQKDK